MSKTSLREKYRNLRVRHLRLQAKYFRLKAKLLAGEPLKIPDMVDKRRYLDVLAKLRRCQANKLHRFLEAADTE